MVTYSRRIERLVLDPSRRVLTHFTEPYLFESLLVHGVLTNREILEKFGYSSNSPGNHVTMEVQKNLPSGSLVSVQDLQAAQAAAPSEIKSTLEFNGLSRVFFKMPPGRHEYPADALCWPGFLGIGTKTGAPTVPPEEIFAVQLGFPDAGQYPLLGHVFSGNRALTAAKTLAPERDWADRRAAETFLLDRAKRLIRRHVGSQAAESPRWNDYVLALAKEHRVAAYDHRGNRLYAPRTARR